MQGLTKRQKMVLDFINRTITSKGYPPTLREIGSHMGIRSTNGVNDHLRALERKGYLKREDMKSRALRPVESASEAEQVNIPVLSRVDAAGSVASDENIDRFVTVDGFFTGKNEDVFLSKVDGDGMTEAGILNGDYVFVKRQDDAVSNQIVLALVGDEATVRYYQPHADFIRLQPADKSTPPVVIRRQSASAFSILGVVIGVYRRY